VPSKLSIAVTLVLVGAVGAFPAIAQAPVVRDSAGIVIVQNPSASHTGPALIRFATRPTLQIGVEEGDRNYQFTEIVAATRLQDGSIAVADRISSEIRVFNSSGQFLRKVGRWGQGPGEFRYLRDVRALPGDSLVAWDAVNDRFAVFDPKGNMVRTFTPRGDSARETRPVGIVRGALRNGTLFLYRVGRQPPPPVRAVVRDTLFVGVYTRDGAYVGPVGRFLGLATLQRDAGPTTRPDGRTVSQFSLAGVPFPRETLFRAGAEWLYVGEGETYEIKVYDRTGSLKRIVRMNSTPRPVTNAIIARHRKSPRSRNSASRPAADVNIDKAFYPRTLPPYAALFVDGADRLWVQDYPVPGEQARWNIFDRDGRLMGSAGTPAGLEVLEIGETHLLGIWRDELDVEYLRLYSFLPPG
jgi:hypothetical protein